MDLYREIILDHYRHPRGWGKLQSPTREAAGFNALCGDAIQIQLEIKDQIIKKFSFTGHGCAISMATASLLSQAVTGQKTADVGKMTRQNIEQLLGTALPPARIKCGLLPLETLQQACAKI